MPYYDSESDRCFSTAEIHDHASYDPIGAYIDRYGKPLGFCAAPGCLHDRHPHSDTNECPLHTILSIKQMQSEDDEPEHPYWAEEIAMWEGLQ